MSQSFKNKRWGCIARLSNREGNGQNARDVILKVTEQTNERYYLSGGERDEIVSAYEGHEQTVVAHLRQTNDLLSAFGFDERGDQGYSHHFYAAGYAAV